MKYLTVPALGTGTEADPYRPDLPGGTPFVGAYDAASGTYLVAVPDDATVPVKAGRTSLSTAKAKGDAIAARKLTANDVDSWRVG